LPLVEPGSIPRTTSGKIRRSAVARTIDQTI
jgi:acyl-coenzyme A synthetase/AMP-(fatty) acid ligase